MHHPPARCKSSKCALTACPERMITTTKVLCGKYKIFVRLLVILQLIILLGYCQSLHSIAKLSRRFCLGEFITDIHGSTVSPTLLMTCFWMIISAEFGWMIGAAANSALRSKTELEVGECHQLTEDEHHHCPVQSSSLVVKPS